MRDLLAFPRARVNTYTYFTHDHITVVRYVPQAMKLVLRLCTVAALSISITAHSFSRAVSRRVPQRCTLHGSSPRLVDILVWQWWQSCSSSSQRNQVGVSTLLPSLRPWSFRARALGRRSLLVRGAALPPAAIATAWMASVPRALAAEAAGRCESDRCSVGALLASSRVPSRLREALRVGTKLVESFNDVTSACDGSVCKVSGRLLRSDYLCEGSTLLSLAEEKALREPTVLRLVTGTDREAYLRNARRYEDSIRLATSCANLAEFDPQLPSFPKGSYVPKGLKDENGNLLGSNLENAREFLLDANDALVVVCSFITYAEWPSEL